MKKFEIEPVVLWMMFIIAAIGIFVLLTSCAPYPRSAEMELYSSDTEDPWQKKKDKRAY